MPEFSQEAVFKSLDSSNVGFLDLKSFVNFLKRMKKKIDEDQASALMRRMEMDQDGQHRIKADEL